MKQKEVPIHKDMMGKVIEIGQKIITSKQGFRRGRHAGLVILEVTEIHPKMIRAGGRLHISENCIVWEDKK